MVDQIIIERIRTEDEIVFGVFKQHLDDFELFVTEILYWLKRQEQTG